MKMIELLEIIQDENRAEEFLRERGVLKTFTHCIRCNSLKPGMIRGDRWKCYTCKAEWTRRKDSILSLVRMKYSEFILCMKFFELELTAEVTAKQLELNYRSVQILFTEFRILLTSFKNIFDDSNLIKDEAFIYIIEKNNKIFLTHHNHSDKSVVCIKIERHFIQGSSAFYHFVFARLNELNALKISKKNLQIHHFIRFAKRRLIDFRGTGKKNLLLRFSEIVYRFNNKGTDIFDHLFQEIFQNLKGG